MITSEWPSAEHPYAVPFIVRQVDFLRKAGVDVDVFHFRGGKKPLNYLKAWRMVRRKLSRHRYDLVHAQWGQSALLALPKRLPLVVTYRGSDLEGIVGPNGRYLLVGKVLKFISVSVSLLADEIIVVSEHLGRKLPGRRYHVIPSGVDLSLFRPTDRNEARILLKLPLERKIVFFGGDPSVARKRYELAQAAVGLVRQKYPDVDIPVARGIKHDQMPYYMNAADVLLLTSRHEGSPNVVKEALACNVPVVSTDVGDVRKRIEGIEGCIVCADDDPRTITRALEQVFSMEGRRVNGREHVRDLDEKLLTEQVIEVYNAAISHRHARNA